MSRHLLWYTVDVYTQKSDKGSFLEYKISKVCKLSVYIHSDEYVHVLIAILFREKKDYQEISMWSWIIQRLLRLTSFYAYTSVALSYCFMY
jgi:hypothetical protein